MKRILALVLSLITAAALTACGGSQAAIKGGSGGTATVAQIMENAGKQREAPAENTAEAPQPAETETPAQRTETAPASDGVDIDLTQMNATMVFAEVSNIMYMPDDYIGKIIRMRGTASSATDPETGNTYHAVIIQDATACCASGLDYILLDGQEYPADETDVTVTGEFELFEENDFFYGQLKDAILNS